MHHKMLIAAVAASLLALAPAARAQSNPSSDDIIKSLKPSTLTGTTRGIRPVTPANPADATAPKPAATHTATAKLPVATTTAPATTTDAAPSVNLTVQFKTGSADLTPQAARTLDQLGRALTSPDLSKFRFRIEGHTDTVGSPDLNKALSEQRAHTVAEYLEKKFSVDAARLEAVGKGDTDLLVKTPPQTPEPRNRRVQVVNLGA